MNLKLKNSLKPLVDFIGKARDFLVALAVLALCGYTAYQISVVVAATPDQATIDNASKEVSSTVTRFDMPTINMIVRQNPLHVAPDLKGLGTSNPFFGN